METHTEGQREMRDTMGLGQHEMGAQWDGDTIGWVNNLRGAQCDGDTKWVGMGGHNGMKRDGDMMGLGHNGMGKHGQTLMLDFHHCISHVCPYSALPDCSSWFCKPVTRL